MKYIYWETMNIQPAVFGQTYQISNTNLTPNKISQNSMNIFDDESRNDLLNFTKELALCGKLIRY